MGIQIGWLDEAQDAVYQRFQGAFTLEEYLAAERDTHRLIAQRPHTVDIVCDLSAARHLPSNLASLAHRPEVPPANSGATIIVGAPVYVRRLAELANRFNIERNMAGRQKNVFVHTQEDARSSLALLRAQRSGG